MRARVPRLGRTSRSAPPPRSPGPAPRGHAAGALLRASIALVTALALGACQRTPAGEGREVDQHLVRQLVVVETGRMNLRTDAIGQGKWATQASFALVDAANRHGEDLMVTLGGSLLDAGGQVVGTLRPASLRIPAGGVRTFALVDDQQAVRGQAASARVDVLGAHVPGYAPTVVVTDGHQYRDGDRVVVTGRVQNAVDQPVRALVLGGFHDARGVPLTRPFVEMYLPGDASHPVELVGPPGSVSGYLFIGDLVY